MQNNVNVMGKLVVSSTGIISAGGNYETWNIAEVLRITQEDLFDNFRILNIKINKFKSPYYQRAIRISDRYLKAIKLIISSNIEDKTIDLTPEIEESLNILKLTGTTVRRHSCFVFDNESLKILSIFRKMLED